MAVLKALSQKKSGLTRSELENIKAIGGGSVLTKDLHELEECGFIRKFRDFTKDDNGARYQLTDPFTLFAIEFMNEKKYSSWQEYINTPGYNAWRGNAFETVCLNHISQIKAALGIYGIESMEFSWRSHSTDYGAQIDLIIDRKDGVVNLCEMKYSNDEYTLDKDEYDKLQSRITSFQQETGTSKAIHVTMICSNGLKHNKYSGTVQNVLSGDDLFDPYARLL